MLQNAIEKTLRSDETSPLDRPRTYAPSSVRGKLSKRLCQSNGQIPEIAGKARQPLIAVITLIVAGFVIFVLVAAALKL